MAHLKTLFKDTVIYGLSSIVGRFLNYLLVPLYTHVISAENGGYGVVTNIYAYVALLLVILTFGMETTFFYFANQKNRNADAVISNCISIIAVLSALFLGAMFTFITPISHILSYDDHPEYILIMSTTTVLDALQAIPFAYLRYKEKATKFAMLKLLFIVLNIGLNLLYYVWLGHTDVLYVFAINLACTTAITFFFLPELLAIRWRADFGLMKEMLSYSWPLLILGIAGILNQAADKIIFPLVYPDRTQGVIELGIYGACVKIALIRAMITQAFRFAYEPIIFRENRNNNSDGTNVMGMKYFLIFTLLAFLCVIAYMPLLKYMIGRDYWDGLRTVPIVMAAEIIMGIYFNLSFWYKTINKTRYGAWFSMAGCAVLFAVNIFFIPRYGYMACAWGGVAGYGTAMILSYIVGQKKHPIDYPLRSMATYTAIALLFFGLMQIVPQHWPTATRLGINTILILAFTAHIIYHDLPVHRLPVIGRYFDPRRR
ncbi:MAG: oligosaccharide flippase family protein [Bacteroidaceae bacterium]|nr:oligosaccharide flippase family protein [Bacteroidaceae bacterium]